MPDYLYQEMPAELSQDQKNVQHAMITMVENHLHWSVYLHIYLHENLAVKVAEFLRLKIAIDTIS